MATSHLSKFQSTWMCFFFTLKPACPSFPVFQRALTLRLWHDRDAEIALQTEVWGHFADQRFHRDETPNRGSRLKASFSFVVLMLAKLERDLIIEVEIENRSRDQQYEMNEEGNYRKSQVKLFILGQDGRFRTC